MLAKSPVGLSAAIILALGVIHRAYTFSGILTALACNTVGVIASLTNDFGGPA